MKTEIHPEYVDAHVRCTCGNEFMTRSTKPEIHVEICSACHPFYTGKQKLVDTGGRVERFQRRVAKGRRSRTPAGSGAAGGGVAGSSAAGGGVAGSGAAGGGVAGA
jgi:large subunit ribosomal protein L31